MIFYSQKSGKAFIDADYLTTGWSGELEGMNNPAFQSLPSIGPIPQGLYTIGAPYFHHELGPIVFNLDPDPSNEMFGRTLFRIHGSAYLHPELSSKGCIILPRFAREKLSLIYQVQPKLTVTE